MVNVCNKNRNEENIIASGSMQVRYDYTVWSDSKNFYNIGYV